jgi:DNA-binding GntR family transcriptional regulator
MNTRSKRPPGRSQDRIVVRPLQRTISAQIAKLVRQRILSGHYPGGAQLLQDVIAAEFGVSKIPVREALVQLSAEGLVDIQAHRGFQVRSMSLAEAEEVLGLRLMIEPQVCAEGARLARHEDHVEAGAALDALNRKVSSRRMDEAGELNLAFHLALTVPRLQPIGAEIVSRLLAISQRYSQVHMAVPGRAVRSIDEHTAIFAAWEAGRSKEVARLIRTHIEETRDDLVDMLKDDS